MRPTYDIATAKGDDAHVQAVSTSSVDVETIVAPRTSTAFYIEVETNGCIFTLDGSTPDGTNGMMLAAGAAPLFVPVGKRDIKFVSVLAGNSVVNVMWLH